MESGEQARQRNTKERRGRDKRRRRESGRSWGNQEEEEERKHTFVIITISSLGRSYFLIAFPRITSDSPFEYTYAHDHQQKPHDRIRLSPTFAVSNV